MPVKYSSTHVCEKCHKKFEWIYFELLRQKLSDGVPIAETIPNTTKAHYFNVNAYGNYEVEVNCPKCGYNNRFVIDTETE